MSDHTPVVLEFEVDVDTNANEHNTFKTKLSWSCATDEQIELYSQVSHMYLSQIQIPIGALTCGDNECDKHCDEINEYYNAIMHACISAGQDCIPKCKPQNVKAGWSEYVAPFKDRSMFWRRMWEDNDKPRFGIVFELMTKARFEYKRRSRWVIRNQEKIKNEKIAEAISSNNQRDFWSEVKKVACKNTVVPNVIDNVQGTENIGAMFRDKYKALYNSVSYKKEDMDSLIKKVCEKGACTCSKGMCYCDHNVTIEDVVDAVARLKTNKADVSEDFNSNHVVYADHLLCVHLSLLFRSMLQHCLVPHDMRLSALVPIQKNKNKSMNDSDNYRSIALGSIIGKVLDNIVLVKHSDILQTSDLQFGFKSKHSTTQCTYVLNEVVDYYVNKGSCCYTVLLDASKAFDRVKYTKLFQLLLDRGMCPLAIRFLVELYTNQCLLVRWDNTCSTSFECTNGIKQGGVLSPTLFCIYMDELLNRLEKSGYGCYIGYEFLGALSYADDLTLVAPSIHALQKMLNVCACFANEYDVLFNASKSVLLLSNASVSDVKLNLNGNDIPAQAIASHLGSFIGRESNSANVSKAINKLVYGTNILMSRYGYCDTSILLSLFQTYCTSYYGCALWDLSKKGISGFAVAWRKCIKRVLKLDMRTRSVYLPLLIDDYEIREQILLRFSRFYETCIHSVNRKVRYVSSLLEQSGTIVANNLRELKYMKSCKHRSYVSQEDLVNASVISELRGHIEGHMSTPLTKNEAKELLHYVSTMRN